MNKEPNNEVFPAWQANSVFMVRAITILGNRLPPLWGGLGWGLFFLLISFSVHAQSYETMENRFVKKQLSAKDSAAFITQGEQKALSLFYQTDLYLRNSGNTSNQAYIANRIPDLFYVAEGDSLDLQPLMDAINTIQRSKKYKQPKFEVTEAPGYLAKLETTNTKPKLEFFLVLMKAPKRFGEEEELVWQVFLTEPVIIP